jgi:hypothetical protein
VRLYLSVKWFLVQEQMKVCWRYYRNWRFALADLLLGLSSLFYNPYRLCRKRGEVYGETPITTLQQIADRIALGSDDCWIDIGAGRGKGALWIATWIGCRVVAIEKIPFLARVTRRTSNFLRLERLAVTSVDASKYIYSGATVVYLYGSSWSDQLWEQIANRLHTLPQGARVISISMPIERNYLKLVDSFPVRFPWGKTMAYLHVV